MIQLVRPETNSFADEIESMFQSWVLAYQCRVEPAPATGSESLFILDGSTRITGEEAIRTWLRELERELSIQRSISGDGCYVHPDTGDAC